MPILFSGICITIVSSGSLLAIHKSRTRIPQTHAIQITFASFGAPPQTQGILQCSVLCAMFIVLSAYWNAQMPLKCVTLNENPLRLNPATFHMVFIIILACPLVFRSSMSFVLVYSTVLVRRMPPANLIVSELSSIVRGIRPRAHHGVECWAIKLAYTETKTTCFRSRTNCRYVYEMNDGQKEICNTFPADGLRNTCSIYTCIERSTCPKIGQNLQFN